MRLINKLILVSLLPLSLMAREATVEQLFSVQTVKVKQETTNHEKKNFGFVKADDARVHHIAPRFGGFVEKIYADKIYKYVRKGEPLVTVYSPEVYKAKEDYLNSYNYTKNKKQKGMLQSAKLKLELLGVNQKEIDELVKSKKVSFNTTIYAHTNGYIFKKTISHGSAFNAKAQLYEIVNLDEVWVETKVYEDDLAWLKNADSFDVSFKSSDKKYTASSTLLYPNLDPKEATLTLRLRLKNTNKELFPGMYASVISKDKTQEYLTLSADAVIRKDGKFYAFVVGEYEGEYDPLEISVKILNPHTYIITEGLNAGDEVVSNALFMLDSDAQINGLY
ncbi:efflux RND transporter periplasmic adaptor subunit [Sulfurimonas sp. SAG-AH-194-C20]|nr:efflux RND transporter periplasmic adaptor subunit [Sulfurimonas sp. SAG-AH-194-C20]MDF1878098.1 efflux RND transporter periplasmic adaptor subunit [Sulfurimonas sp. SAG-AH-194-C20]